MVGWSLLAGLVRAVPVSLRWPLVRRSPEDLAKGAARSGAVVVLFRALATAVAVSALGLAGSAAAQAAPASGGQLTGTQLGSALLPVSYFPAGYAILWAGSSGSRLEHPAVKVDQYTFSCKLWLKDGEPDEGFGETAYAGDVVARRLALQDEYEQWVAPKNSLRGRWQMATPTATQRSSRC